MEIKNYRKRIADDKIEHYLKENLIIEKIVKCLNEIEPECFWVIEGEGYATEKLDGTCCLIKDGNIYRRYDYKPGRKLPQNAIPCQEKADDITGHFPHWLLCKKDEPNDKYHIEAYLKQKDYLTDGTYELIGKHFNSNPYNLDEDILEKHGQRILENVPRTYEGIKEYLQNNYIEGIVFYRENGEMCKIKRSDFGFEWNNNIKNRVEKLKLLYF